jgi:anaerobic magnesium-protoporphyrin IX monomethyl ester cyclase
VDCYGRYAPVYHAGEKYAVIPCITLEEYHASFRKGSSFMRVILIATLLQDYVNGVLSPISMDATKTCPPYGIYHLATCLSEHGHEAFVIDQIAQGTPDLRPHAALLATADLIGIGTSSLSWPTARDCIAVLASSFPAVPIVLGGIHATMFDRYVLETTGANFVVRGEGEVALPVLCEAMLGIKTYSDVPNLTYKLMSGKIVRNPSAGKITAEQLSAYPLPDYGSVPFGAYYGLAIETSRGCPFDCIFCSTAYRKTWRGIPAEVVVDRIEQATAFLPRTTGGVLQIIDDEFTTDTARTMRICDLLNKRNLYPRLVYDARINDLLEMELVCGLAPYTEQFLVGAECGYDRGLATVGKRTTCAKMSSAAENLMRTGIAEKADFSFVIGFPWETKDEVMQTVRFAHHLHSSFGVRILLQWYCQIPGSRLWNEQRSKEIVHESLYDNYGFFRNHYLFRTGVRLKPSEIFDVQDVLESIKAGSGKNRYGMPLVECSSPEAIIANYPRRKFDDNALASLREAAGVFENHHQPTL